MPTITTDHSLGDVVWVVDQEDNAIYTGTIINIYVNEYLTDSLDVEVTTEYRIYSSETDSYITADEYYVRASKATAYTLLQNILDDQIICP